MDYSFNNQSITLDLLEKVNMLECKPTTTTFQLGVKLTKECTFKSVDATLYKQLVGSLVYLTRCRLDICFAVNLVSRFMQAPKESHWLATKRIFRYIHGTLHHDIHYGYKSLISLVGYIDSDWGGDIDDRKSTSGYVFQLCSGSITWSNKKQTSTSLSSCEAEYRAAKEARKEPTWI